MTPIFSWSGPACYESSKNLAALHSVGATFKEQLGEAYQCVEQEVVDPLIDPWRVQSLAMRLCEESPQCLVYLKKQAAEVSNLPIERFKDMKSVQLWGEINRYAGFTRKRPPQLSDLPLEKNPEEIFDELKKIELSERSLSGSELKKALCAGLFMVVGPSKFKAAPVVASLAKRRYVTELTHEVTKILDKNKLPFSVKERFLKWQAEVEGKSLEEVRKIPGFHDEPIKSRTGERSVRLNKQYRIFYETLEEQGVTKIKVLSISPHDY